MNRGRWRAVRDLVIFGVGICGIIYETVWESADRPTLLLLFAAMVGLPAFIRGDEFMNGRDKEKDRDAP